MQTWSSRGVPSGLAVDLKANFRPSVAHLVPACSWRSAVCVRLAASAGLNAYISLSLVELVAWFTDWINLGPTWEPLTSWWVIGALRVLGLIGFFAGMIPAVNHANVLIQTIVRPAAGAVLFVISTNKVIFLDQKGSGASRREQGWSFGDIPTTAFALPQP